MLKKLSVVSETYSLNVDIHDTEVALIDLQSFRNEDDVDVAEVVVSKEELKEIIRMLEYTLISMK